jgi:hypothetical protein
MFINFIFTIISINTVQKSNVNNSNGETIIKLKRNKSLHYRISQNYIQIDKNYSYLLLNDAPC